jgi:hypothetical protein
MADRHLTARNPGAVHPRRVTLHGLAAMPSFDCEGPGCQSAKSATSLACRWPTIERYCRFADRKASGQAALVQLTAGRNRR